MQDILNELELAAVVEMLSGMVNVHRTGKVVARHMLKWHLETTARDHVHRDLIKGVQYLFCLPVTGLYTPSMRLAMERAEHEETKLFTLWPPAHYDD